MNAFWKKFFDQTNEIAENIVNINAVKMSPEKQAIMNKMMNNTTEIPMPLQSLAHRHTWFRGVLPGQDYIKQCNCGVIEHISLAEWTQL